MREKVVELKELPAPDPGDPAPIIVADDHDLALSYRICDRNEGWGLGEADQPDRPVVDQSRVIVVFTGVLLHRFGYPNDEALEGHRLHGRGLTCYCGQEVLHSTWPEEVERQNRVHQHAEEGQYSRFRHFVFTFHDSTFECLALGFTARRLRRDPKDLENEMAALLRGPDSR